MTHYVAGFMFDAALERVALIRKMKPEWQRGKLNGIGGKVELGETPGGAMRREFLEETGVETFESDWTHFARLEENGQGESEWIVDFFLTIGDLSKLMSVEAEKIEIRDIHLFSLHPNGTIENIPWLIGLAIDHMTDGRPSFVTAIY